MSNPASADAVAAISQAAAYVAPDEAAQLIAALARRLTAGATGEHAQTIRPTDAVALDDCAEIFVPVPQWTTADRQIRGVWLRAPQYRDDMLAEREATVRDPKTGEERIDDYRRVAELVSRVITRPAVRVDTLLSWNTKVVYALYNRAMALADLPGALVAAELARLAGGPPPPPAPAPARPERPARPAKAAARPAPPDPPPGPPAGPPADRVGGDDQPPDEPDPGPGE